MQLPTQGSHKIGKIKFPDFSRSYLQTFQVGVLASYIHITSIVGTTYGGVTTPESKLLNHAVFN